jgi:mono/diheme cytochrome c family protein
MSRAIIAACAFLALAWAASAEDAATPVFTAEQAVTGKTAYTRACARCHLPDLSGGANEVPPLAGSTFISTWGSRSTKDLFDYVSGAMPPGGPAESKETYEALLAFILQSNGAVAGPKPLTYSTDTTIATLTSLIAP